MENFPGSPKYDAKKLGYCFRCIENWKRLLLKKEFEPIAPTGLHTYVLIYFHMQKEALELLHSSYFIMAMAHS